MEAIAPNQRTNTPYTPFNVIYSVFTIFGIKYKKTSIGEMLAYFYIEVLY
jgi:hypothetical protein